MYIASYMSPSPVTVGPEESIPAVHRLLQEHKFRHLPVVAADKTLVGMVTDRDLRSAFPSTVLCESVRQAALTALAETPVSSIMSTRVTVLTPASTLDDALFLLDRERVGALPVVDASRRVVGVFSVRDLLRAYKELFGVGERGSALVAVFDDGQPHPLTRIARALEEHDVTFTRVIRTEHEGRARIYLRVKTFNIRAVQTALQAIGFAPELNLPPESSGEGSENSGGTGSGLVI
ncbi:MAG: hypothetical protein A2521_00150 [Deltaproteobacteria bacterium RIFOXYD12_FULL_57_12]|nr:MAG: hypothetical protein A2521_00150 [Deltaproteobacteria bacterium RIFOXYD12_FULL_57_12]